VAPVLFVAAVLGLGLMVLAQPDGVPSRWRRRTTAA
jgi:hypothetical protein